MDQKPLITSFNPQTSRADPYNSTQAPGTEQVGKLQEVAKTQKEKAKESRVLSASPKKVAETALAQSIHDSMDDKDRYLNELQKAFDKVTETQMKNHDHQVHIVSFHPEDNIYVKNTAALVAKHKSNTTLLFMNTNGDIVTVYGKELSEIGGKVRISIEGHGESRTLEGYTLDQIKNNIIKVNSLMTKDHSIDKVSFISCKIDTTDNPDDISSRFGHKIITRLDDAGLTTKVSVRTLSVSIDHNTGQKEVEDGIERYKKYYEGTYVYSMQEGKVKRENAHPDAPVLDKIHYRSNLDGSIDVIKASDSSIIKSFRSVEDFNNRIEMQRSSEEEAPPPLPKKKGKKQIL